MRIWVVTVGNPGVPKANNQQNPRPFDRNSEVSGLEFQIFSFFFVWLCVAMRLFCPSIYVCMYINIYIHTYTGVYIYTHIHSYIYHHISIMFFLEKAEMAKMLDICSISAWMFLKPQDSQEQHRQQREVPILR